MKKFESFGKMLSKKEQRNLFGGVGDNCSVSCASGYYACCCAGDCRCISTNDQTDHQCSTGGTNRSTCKYPSDPT